MTTLIRIMKMKSLKMIYQWMSEFVSKNKFITVVILLLNLFLFC